MSETSNVTPATEKIFYNRDKFIELWEQCLADGRGPAGVAEVLGKDKNTVLTRASKYRSEGFELSKAKKGGGAKLDNQKSLEILAAARGMTVEQLQELAAKGKAEREARKAAKAAKAAAEKSAG